MVAASQFHYSPDTAQCFFFLFPWVNQDLKGKRFADLQRFNMNRWWRLAAFRFNILDNVSSKGSGTGSLHPVTGGRALWRGLKFQTCKNVLNIFFFLQFREFLGPPSYIMRFTSHYSCHFGHLSLWSVCR